jgi:hypothetical protein
MSKKKEDKVIKLDLGSGPNKKEGFIGVDKYKMKGVDVVIDLGKEKWPWKDNSVDEVNCTHFIEHLTNFNGKFERVHFFNELFRVLKKGVLNPTPDNGKGKYLCGFANLIFPHWCSNRYYGDPTHCEPFSEMGFYYLSRDWRKSQAPHTDKEWNKNGYDCDFEAQWGYSLRQDLMSRNNEYQQNALQTQKEAAQDIIATLIKK